MRELRFGKIAERDIGDAVQWYERQRQGLGVEFLERLEQALTQIQETPETWPRSVVDPGLHRKLLDRFPYAVVYRVRESVIFVRAVAHARRRPGYWR